jgi:transcriptional regulator with XRE-family HTH domain
MKTLGERVRELRVQKDLSLRELARKIKRSPAHLSDIELGRRYPSPEVLAEIAQALATTSEELKKYDNRPPLSEMRRMAEKDPQWGFAFRQMLERRVPGQDLQQFMDTWKKKK